MVIVILKVVGVIAFAAFSVMCMWEMLKHTFNWHKKDERYDKY